MEKLILLQQILSCIKDNKDYQNHLKETLLNVQQKLRWISLTKKQSLKKSQKSKSKCKRKRIPYHPCYQLLNMIKTKIKRPHLPPFKNFNSQDLNLLICLHEKFPKNWEKIGNELGKNPLLSFKNYVKNVLSKKEFSDKVLWTSTEDSQLFEAVDRYGEKNWSEVANWVDGKTSSQCYHRYMKTLNPYIKRGKWGVFEDIKLLLGVKIFGTNWVTIAGLIKNRTDIQCRERFCNVLCPSINSRGWSAIEDFKLILLILLWGKKWSKIAKFIDGRTDNQCWRRSKNLIKHSEFLKGLVVFRIFRPKITEELAGFLQKVHTFILKSAYM